MCSNRPAEHKRRLIIQKSTTRKQVLSFMIQSLTNVNLYFNGIKLQLSYANRYRYRSRMFFNPISYPPTIDGNEDYETSTAKEENQFIKKVLNIKKHPETPIFPNEYSVDGPPKGRIYEKLPFKFTVEKNKVYSFCTCGYSNSQVSVFLDRFLKICYLSKIPFPSMIQSIVL